jgi:transposase-like protein
MAIVMAAIARTVERSLNLGQLDQPLVESALRLGAPPPGDEGADELIALIEASFAKRPICCHCRSSKCQKWGRASGLRRYHCAQCGKTFNALTGTPLARLRQREAWAEFSAELAEGLSVRKAAQRCGIDATTSFRWRRRFLQVVQNKK